MINTLFFLILSLLSTQTLYSSDNTTSPKLWSILICTLEERKESFEKLYHKLQTQIKKNNLENQIEILSFKDNRTYSVGFKRNTLLQQSNGEYVCFVDDDDDIHDNYIGMIYNKLLAKPDCVKLIGVITTNEQNPQIFIHSTQYNNKYCQEDGIYYRPPNHLNPIKRSIAIQCSFPEKSFGEDRDWTLQLAQKNLIKTEANIDEPYYFYHYDGKYHQQGAQKIKPRVSIITSVFKGDEFIEDFLIDITRQSIFGECELIIINANSPGHEEPIIKKYCKYYPNIIYERLAADPGLYGVWNYAIKKARADLITNANIDDRRNPFSLEAHAQTLEQDSNIDLVYSDFYLTYRPNETFEQNSRAFTVQPSAWAPEKTFNLVVGPQPMWRKSLHNRYGFFDENYFSASDFEFTSRLVSQGVKFAKTPDISGLFYQNPTGLSNNQNPVKMERHLREEKTIEEQFNLLHIIDCETKTINPPKKCFYKDLELLFFDEKNSCAIEITMNELKNNSYDLANYHFEQDDVIIDIGAHVGIISIILAKLYPQTQIYAYEASPINFLHLRKNIELNNVKNIKAFNFAVTGISDQVIKFFDASLTGYSGGSTLFREVLKYTADHNVRSFSVPTISLDHILERNKITSCALLKIDCEGAEYEILQNSDFFKLGFIKNLAGEFHAIKALQAKNYSTKALTNICKKYVKNRIDLCYYKEYDDSEQQEQKPRVSIITSIYQGDEFIRGFLADIVQQSIFNQAELILINANSPGNEERIIKEYCLRYPNIIYERLDHDPGVYGIWNYAIKKAHAALITNANLDDRRNPLALETHVQTLEQDPSIDLVYSDYFITYFPNETFENNHYRFVAQASEFSPQLLFKCLPGPFPTWRKSLHERFGFFDESFFSAGDLEFWNRIVSNGIRFKKIPGVSGLFYQNPQGLSTNENTEQKGKRLQENQKIAAQYKHLWNS